MARARIGRHNSLILWHRTFLPSPVFPEGWGTRRRGEAMTERSQLAKAPRDRLLEAARKELADFERREKELREKDREERAAELGLPYKQIVWRRLQSVLGL